MICAQIWQANWFWIATEGSARGGLPGPILSEAGVENSESPSKPKQLS